MLWIVIILLLPSLVEAIPPPELLTDITTFQPELDSEIAGGFFHNDLFISSVNGDLYSIDTSAESNKWHPQLLRSGIKIFSFLGATQNLSYFVSSTNHGNPHNIWRTDGTPDGTFVVHRVRCGSPNALKAISLNDYLIFSGRHIYSTSGTSDSTQALLSDEVCYYNEGNFDPFFFYNGRVYFTTTTEELWSTDGTKEGTSIVSKLEGVGSSEFGTSFVSLETGFLFSIGQQLWQSDGTDAGTRPFHYKNIFGDKTNKAGAAIKRGLKRLVFDDADGENGPLIYGTDLDGENSVSLFRFLTHIRQFELNGRVIYLGVSFDQAIGHFQGVWVTDSTLGGTFLLYQDPLSEASSMEAIKQDGKLYVLFNEKLLWETDGTAVGSRATRSTNEGRLLSTNSDFLVFTERDPTTGSEFTFHELDGARRFLRLDATQMDNVEYSNFAKRGSFIYNCAYPKRGLPVLFSISEPDATVSNLHTFNEIPGSGVRELVRSTLGIYILFNRFSNAIYYFDLTGSTISKIRDSGGSSRHIHHFNNELYTTYWGIFNFIVPTYGYSYSKINSTGNRTSIFITEGGRSNGPPYFAQHNGQLFTISRDLFPFATYNPVDIEFDPIASGFGLTGSEITSIGTTMLFSGPDFELWRSDGDEASTELLVDIRPGPAESEPKGFTHIDGKAYFSAVTDQFGREPYRSDGKIGGTYRLGDIANGAASSNPTNFISSGKFVYFKATNAAGKTETWRLLKGNPEVNLAFKFEYLGPLTDIGALIPINENGVIVFRAFHPLYGLELYAANGITGFVERITDLEPGRNSSAPDQLFVSEGFLYFSAYNRTIGREIWRYPISSIEEAVSPPNSTLLLTR